MGDRKRSNQPASSSLLTAAYAKMLRQRNRSKDKRVKILTAWKKREKSKSSCYYVYWIKKRWRYVLFPKLQTHLC